MDKNGLPWEENDYVKLNICVQINGLKMQQFWTDSLDDPVVIQYVGTWFPWFQGQALLNPQIQAVKTSSKIQVMFLEEESEKINFLSIVQEKL